MVFFEFDCLISRFWRGAGVGDEGGEVGQVEEVVVHDCLIVEVGSCRWVGTCRLLKSKRLIERYSSIKTEKYERIESVTSLMTMCHCNIRLYHRNTS